MPCTRLPWQSDSSNTSTGPWGCKRWGPLPRHRVRGQLLQSRCRDGACLPPAVPQSSPPGSGRADEVTLPSPFSLCAGPMYWVLGRRRQSCAAACEASTPDGRVGTCGPENVAAMAAVNTDPARLFSALVSSAVNFGSSIDGFTVGACAGVTNGVAVYNPSVGGKGATAGRCWYTSGGRANPTCGVLPVGTQLRLCSCTQRESWDRVRQCGPARTHARSWCC